jgi:glutamine synthetase
MTRPAAAADPAEAEAFLAAHPGVEAIDILLHDSNAIARGKTIRRHELAGLYADGRHLPVSILGLDVLGEDVHETGLIWDTGDSDLRAWPVPGSLALMAGTGGRRAELLLSLYHLDGAPMLSDPRHALAAQVAALAGQGMQASAAFELEFFLLDPARDDRGRVRPAADVLDGRRSARTEVYSVDALHGMAPLFDAVYEGARLAGITAETLISEYAPGQFELTLRYRDDPMQAADDLVRMKRIVRAQARRFGVLACFMAKPMADCAGSGMHLHVSLRDRSGRNLFAEAPGAPLSDTIRQAMGGMLATMGDSMLVFAPHANSWRRFASRSYAPVSATWGVNNRSVALRIPAGPAAARRIEHRVAGVDANPWLVAATVLAALRHGLDARIDPGPETTGNGYAAEPRARLPSDWAQAIRAAQGSAFLRAALGEEMHRTFTAVKAAEYARVAATIPDVDYDLYLHRI